MKSKNIKKVIEVLPMKKGETLTNVKTKVNTAYIPQQFIANTDSDVLLVMVNSKSGEYLGNMKITYSEHDVPFIGFNLKKRIANVELSEFADSIDEALYIKTINECMHGQSGFDKFANYIQVDRGTLSERMDAMLGKTHFKPIRQNPQILELNIEAQIILLIAIVLLVL